LLVEDEAEMAKALSAALKQYDMIVDRGDAGGSRGSHHRRGVNP